MGTSSGIAALERLHELADRMLTAPNAKAAAEELLAAALDLLGADAGIVELADVSGALEVAAESGAGLEARSSMQTTPLVGADGRVLGVLSTRGANLGALSQTRRHALRLLVQQAVSTLERLRASMRGDESERRYRTLFDSIDQAFAVVQLLFDENDRPVDYRFLETNPVYLRHTTVENAVGRTARELVPTIEPQWIETFGRVALTGEPERFTERVAGIERWLDGYAFRFGPPRDRQVALFFRDVTEERIVEQRDRFLLALDDATRSLVEPEAIASEAARMLAEYLHADRAAYTEVDEDEDGVVVIGEWSPELPSILGRYRFSDYGQTLRKALFTGRPFVIDDLATSELTANERVRYAEHQVLAMIQVPLHKGGKLRSSLAVYHAASRRWGPEEIELVRLVASRCWEAIERARVASQLRDSEEQFRTLASLLPQFIWIALPDGRISWFNEYAHEFFGWDAEIEGFGWTKFHDPELFGEIERGYLEAIASGSPYSCTTRFRNKDGEYHWFIARMLPQRDEQGNVLRFLGYNFDVSDLYETQARLVEADRRKDEFLATLAHELRNPLAPLSNMLEILKLRPGQGIDRELREVMQRQVHHLGRLVDDLLDASRITRGVIELQRERVLLGEVLGAAIETSRPLVEARRHRLQVEAPEEPLWLDADAVRLTQVFANLLNNASKYTDENGRIGIHVATDEGHAVVTVSDDGIGIAPEMLTRVFELFTQVDRHSGRAQGGLGIGLSLSRRLVEMHGGSLEADSEGVGRGSRFTVRLPLVEAGLSVAAPASEPREPAGGSRFKLLVVDDNVDAAESLGFLLRSLGGDVDVVYDGMSALALLEQSGYDAAFIDLGMPIVDGLEVARRVRGQSRFDDLLLVAVTGWGQEEDRLRSRRAGFDHHLVKPAEMTSLEQVLAELADGRGRPKRATGQ